VAAATSSAPAAPDDRLAHEPPLRERVRDRLEQLIIDGVFPPGEHLVETELAARLGVSRGPVREALYELSLRGWVDMRPRQGSFVHQPSTEEVDQFFHVRNLLEKEAASLACGHASPDVVKAMKQEIAAARKAMAAGDERALVHATAGFHGHIYRLAGNDVLHELIDQLDKRLRWYFAPLALERPAEAWAEHDDLVNAIVAGDRRRAASIMRRHTDATRRSFLAGRGQLASAEITSASAAKPTRRAPRGK
jgi:DNA-binding GntR family transcriptional regulator